MTDSKISLYSKKGTELIQFLLEAGGIYDSLKKNGLKRFDGIIWWHNGKEINIEIPLVSGDASHIYIYKEKLFLTYNGISHTHPAPDNLVVYNNNGEVERVLTTPILPNGMKAAGFLQMAVYEDRIEAWVWEAENSPWIYMYDLNIDTYEFTFLNRGRL